MAEDKPGFFGRLFGRKPGDAKPGETPKSADPAQPAEAAPLDSSRWTGGADASPAMPREEAGSVSEGAPDFTTAAAAGEIAPAQPTVTQASPDLPQSEKPAPELAGGDMQPVEEWGDGVGRHQQIPALDPGGAAAQQHDPAALRAGRRGQALGRTALQDDDPGIGQQLGRERLWPVQHDQHRRCHPGGESGLRRAAQAEDRQPGRSLAEAPQQRGLGR